MNKEKKLTAIIVVLVVVIMVLLAVIFGLLMRSFGKNVPMNEPADATEATAEPQMTESRPEETVTESKETEAIPTEAETVPPTEKPVYNDGGEKKPGKTENKEETPKETAPANPPAPTNPPAPPATEPPKDSGSGDMIEGNMGLGDNPFN